MPMEFARMRQRLDWSDLRLVLAIGRGGSLSAAARALGLDHSTVHRRIGQVEDRLGVRLFERLRSGYVPTAAGEEAVAIAARVEEEVLALELKLAGEDLRPSGAVRVATSDAILAALLTPLVAELRRVHPGIVLEVGTTSLAVDLARREADVAVRVTNEPPEHLIGRRLGTIAGAAYGAPAYLDGLAEGLRAGGTDPAAYDWIGFDESLGHIGTARWMRAAVPAERIAYRADTVLGMADAARLGIGIAALPDALGDRVPGLRRLDPSPIPRAETGFWVLTHPGLRHVARVKAVFEFLALRLREELAEA
jgi:DNA-binding transcriptional LysR family regulator